MRTRDTATPSIEGLGIELSLYDPGNLEELAKELLLVPGRYLVVGHGDTTPELARLLGAEPGSDIAVAGKKVGEVTSSCRSALAGSIALGFVRAAHAATGTELHAAGRPARVAALPFAGPGASTA